MRQGIGGMKPSERASEQCKTGDREREGETIISNISGTTQKKNRVLDYKSSRERESPDDQSNTPQLANPPKKRLRATKSAA